MPKIALIDGSGFIFRAFHALPPLSTSKGVQTNAVYGFTRMVLSLIDSLKVNYLAVIFDASRKNFRNEIYSEYKTNRPPPPEELIHQFSLIREASAALNITTLEKEGYEADDIIATYTTIAEEQGFEVIIVSSDKDLMQLIKSPTIYMYDPVKKKPIKETEVLTKFGLPPDKLIYAQALIGDSIDNIPGVKGLGPKTAASLIKQYDSLVGIYHNIDKINKPALKEKLLTNKTNAFISLELVTLKKDIPLLSPLENLKVKNINPYTLHSFCEKLEFKSLAANIAKKYNLDQSSLGEDELLNNKESESIEELKESNIQDSYKNKVYNYKVINYTQELTSLFNTLKFAINLYLHFDNNTVALVDDSLNVYLIIINQQDKLLNLFDDYQPFSNIKVEDFKNFIEPLLLNRGINKVLYNVKNALYILSPYQISTINSYNDIHIMSYVLDGPSPLTSLEEISKTHLLCSLSEIEPNLASTLPDKFLGILLQQVICIQQLYNIFKPRLVFEKTKYIYEYIDRPLVKTLYDMEQKGVLIDPTHLSTIDNEINKEIKLVEEEIYKISEEKFNINSPKQVGEILYNKLKIKGKKNKSGSWKTDAYFLEELDNLGNPIAGLIINWRQLSKLKNNYIDTLPSYISQQDGRIHTTFLQTSTNTGRISSFEPNLQNIPVKTNLSKDIRKAFIASPGNKLISLDYSQIELRLLAHIGNVEGLINAFNEDKDIHITTAKEIFNLKTASEVTSEYRRKAKTINFGIIYGISEFGLAKRLQIDKEEAKHYIQSYFQKYPEILDYMEAAKDEARKYGYVLTEYGRKCYIRGINSSNHNTRSFAERAAINAKLQGTASDLMRMALIKGHNYILRSNFEASIILQVHDELLIEAQEKNAASLAEDIANIMENICTLKVPLIVNYSIADNWLEAH